jgi:hypothetical protein
MKDMNIFIHPLGPWPRHCRPGASTQHSRYIVCHANTCVKASYARKGFGQWPITRCKHIKSRHVPYVMTTTQPRPVKHVASILLALGPTWGPAPPPRSTLSRNYLYSSSRRFLVVPSLTLGFPHKIPNRASVTSGLPRCSTEISSMASDLHSQGLSCHVLPYTAPGFFTGRMWSS